MPASVFYSIRDLDQLSNRYPLDPQALQDIRVVSQVFEFRVSRYVVDELLDWSDWRNDPFYRMLFPQRGMLTESQYDRISSLLDSGQFQALRVAANEIRRGANPHPDDQASNRPVVNGRPLPGIQHKYPSTVLFFPAKGQQCHSYCTYCFRWAQFGQDTGLRFRDTSVESLLQYLASQEADTSQLDEIVFTGGDPLQMSSRQLAECLLPLLDADLEQIRTIRFGTKSIAFWPYRFTSDPDADELLSLLCQLRKKFQVAFMLHNSHPRELSTNVAGQALSRLRDCGVVLRSQAPIVRGINDDAATLRQLWSDEKRHDIAPYYLFIPRDTGPSRHFAIPISRALEVFWEAVHEQSGMVHMSRGPVLSTSLGKVLVKDVVKLGQRWKFAVEFTQAQPPYQANRLFFLDYDPAQTWFAKDELERAYREWEQNNLGFLSSGRPKSKSESRGCG